MKHVFAVFSTLSRLTMFIVSAAVATNTGLAQQWLEQTPTGQIPPLDAGEDGGVAYNPAGNQLITFAGGNPYTNGVHILSNANGLGGASVWTELNISGAAPPARAHNSLVYDPGSNRLIVFGGSTPSSLLNDTWVLSNADGLEATPPVWTQLSPGGTPPAPRATHTAVFDPASNRMIIFGGCTGGPASCDTAQNDCFVLTNATGLGGTPQWVQLSTNSVPPPRGLHTALFDTDTNRMIVFGGLAGDTGIYYADVWVLQNANGLGSPQWTQINVSGTYGPKDRYGFASAFNSRLDEVIVFGGVSGNQYTNDVWVLTNANGSGSAATWEKLNPSGTPPSALQNRMSVLDSATDRLIVFGGDNSNESWILAGAGVATPEPTCSSSPSRPRPR